MRAVIEITRRMRPDAPVMTIGEWCCIGLLLFILGDVADRHGPMAHDFYTNLGALALLWAFQRAVGWRWVAASFGIAMLVFMLMSVVLGAMALPGAPVGSTESVRDLVW